MNYYVLAWIAATVIFLIVEIATVGLASIWFMIGSLAALVLALLDVSFIWQFVVFVVVSAVMLIFTRKILVEKLHVGKIRTNVDSLIGSEGVVTSKIERFSTGLVKVRGQIWTALSEDKSEIAEDTKVTIRRIDGVKLIVIPAKENI